MAAASEAAQPLQVPPLPPLPPKLRREPQRSSIGEGLLFTDEAAFQADHAAWVVEQRCRRSQVRERERVQDQRRDRSQRQRGTELETDSQRRVRQKRERSQHEKQLAQQSYAQLSACLFASAPAPAAARQPALATPARQPWDQIWSEEVPALVMDHAIPVNPDPWYSRLARHGFVAGNMMTHSMETDALYAVARDRRHSI